MIIIVPGANVPSHRSLTAPTKTAPAPTPLAFSDYLADAGLTAMPERQSAWSFSELGVFGHARCRDRTPAADNPDRPPVAAPALKTASVLPAMLQEISEDLESTAPQIVDLNFGTLPVAALTQTAVSRSTSASLADETATAILADMPETASCRVPEPADDIRAEHANSSNGHFPAEVTRSPKNTSDIKIAVFGAGKSLQVSALVDGLDVDARIRLRKMIDATLEHYGHAASSLYVNGALQDRPSDGAFTSIIQGGSDGDCRG